MKLCNRVRRLVAQILFDQNARHLRRCAKWNGTYAGAPNHHRPHSSSRKPNCAHTSWHRQTVRENILVKVKVLSSQFSALSGLVHASSGRVEIGGGGPRPGLVGGAPMSHSMWQVARAVRSAQCSANPPSAHPPQLPSLPPAPIRLRLYGAGGVGGLRIPPLRVM